MKWSPEAIEDLESIAEYIARDSDFYSHSVVSQILGISRILEEFPLIGRIVPEIGDENIRERLIYSYRLVYMIKTDEILIVSVMHGKRLIEQIADRLEKNP